MGSIKTIGGTGIAKKRKKELKANLLKQKAGPDLFHAAELPLESTILGEVHPGCQQESEPPSQPQPCKVLWLSSELLEPSKTKQGFMDSSSRLHEEMMATQEQAPGAGARYLECGGGAVDGKESSKGARDEAGDHLDLRGEPAAENRGAYFKNIIYDNKFNCKTILCKKKLFSDFQ